MDEEKIRYIEEEYVKRSETVDYSVILPESEAEVMLAMWNESETLFTSTHLMETIGRKKGWKASTLISFLSRLEEKGFVMSYKNGKERYYIPLAERMEYLSAVTNKFVEKYHSSSLGAFLEAMYYDKAFSDRDIDELIAWLEKRRDR